jgi:hypothetical protein
MRGSKWVVGLCVGLAVAGCSSILGLGDLADRVAGTDGGNPGSGGEGGPEAGPTKPCTANQNRCNGNGVETCTAQGTWGAAQP